MLTTVLFVKTNMLAMQEPGSLIPALALNYKVIKIKFCVQTFIDQEKIQIK